MEPALDQNPGTILFEGNASAFIFDLRNSTKIVKKSSESNCLSEHVKFMLALNTKILTSLSSIGTKAKFAFNDTGDGCLCVFWDKDHSVTCLKVALDIYQYLNITLEDHNKNLAKELDVPELRFGMGLHTDHCSIGRIEIENSNLKVIRDYIFGTVANSVARLESFSKNYIHDNFLITANFMNLVVQQFDTKESKQSLAFRKLLQNTNCLGEVDLKDSKEDGHWIHSLDQVTIDEALVTFGLYRHQNQTEEIL